MGFRRTWMYIANRRWQKNSFFFLVIIILLACISIHQVLLLLEKNEKLDVLQIDSVVNSQYNIREKISDVKKNINDIVYQGVDDENPSRESFLGLFKNQSNGMILDKKNTKNFLFWDKSLQATYQNYFLHNKPNKKMKKKKKWDGTKFISNFEFKTKRPKWLKKYLYVLGHYEQLGKTLINFMHAGLLASLMNRKIVVPFVRNSRLCGLPSGWIGSLRKKSREFLVMDNYADMNSVEKLFNQEGFADMCQFDEFHSTCQHEDSTMLYFFYSGTKNELKRYLQLTESEYKDIEKQFETNLGWANCMHVEKRVKSGKRMGGMTFTNAFCIDPEQLTSISGLNSLTNSSTCLSIFLWRGLGPQRTHFNLTLPLSYKNYLAKLSFSDIVKMEAKDFQRSVFANKQYIGIQIRSERQLGWYGLEKFKHCLDLVVKVASIFVVKKKIEHIFVSADLEKHGSDQLSQVVNSTTLEEAKMYFRESFRGMPVEFYKPDKSRGLIYNDAGYVALTQMEILSRSSHLITLGAGTFQNWVTSYFKNSKNETQEGQPWSLTRICSVELKGKRKVKINSTVSS